MIPCALLILGVGSMLAVASEIVYVLVGQNFHVVVQNQCYRSGQPSLRQLEGTVRDLGIRTVINLRGDNDGVNWYDREKQKAKELGVVHLDAGLFGRHPPYEDDLHNLIKALDRAVPPILLHCQSGGDRAGLASTAFLLLKSDTPLEEARKQLSLRFGHNPFGNAACQGRLLDSYARWLQERNLTHTPDYFRNWACKHYRRVDVINECDLNRPPTFVEPPIARFD